MAMIRKVNTWVVDSMATAKLCIDAARPRALLENTKVEWQTDESYKENWLFSAAYAVMPWKEPPGNAFVETGHEEVKKRTFALAAHYQDVFYRKLLESPAEGQKYASALVTMGTDATDLYMQQLADARQLNRQIEDYWTAHVAVLKGVKTGSGLLTSLLTPHVGAIQGWATFGVELVQATSLQDATFVVGKKTIEEAAGKAGEKFAKDASEAQFKNASITWKLAQEGAAKMEAVSASLMRKKSSAKIAKLTRALDTATTAHASNLAKTSRSLKNAGLVRRLIPGGLAVLFAVPDILDIIEEVRSMQD
jgi:hypothetical protein